MTEPTIDPAVFKELQDAAGADFVVELVGTFLEEAPAMLTELSSARTAHAADRFRRAAHSLKSNSQAFGALTLGAMARALELGGLPGDAAPIDDIAAEYERVAARLKELNGG